MGQVEETIDLRQMAIEATGERGLADTLLDSVSPPCISCGDDHCGLGRAWTDAAVRPRIDGIAAALRRRESLAMQLTIRQAELDDARAVARLHVAVWRATYRALAPEAAFRALDETVRFSRWVALLSAPPRDQSAFVAEIGGALAGFGLAGAPGDPVFGGRGEIKFLYVDGAVRRRGIGRRLLADLARHVASCGYRGVALGVVVGNAPAMSFYEAQGGTAIGRYRYQGPLWRSENIVYAWDDLAALIAPAKSGPR